MGVLSLLIGLMLGIVMSLHDLQLALLDADLHRLRLCVAVGVRLKL